MTHMILSKMDALFGCSYKNLLDWLVFFPEPNHNKICWEQTHVKMDLGEVLHMRNMSNLLKAKKWKTKWDFTRQILLRNISIWKEIAHFDTLARKWIPDFWINRNHGVEVVFQRWKVLMSSPFLQAIFFWSQILLFLHILSCLHDQLSSEYVFYQYSQKLMI